MSIVSPIRPHHLPIETVFSDPAAAQLPFGAQPLANGRSVLYGYELLYCGPKGRGWAAIDEIALRALGGDRAHAPLFVNLSNETILTIDEGLLFAAHANNNIYFEWSEAVVEQAAFRVIVTKINRWIRQGLRFVIDDFGSGRDGFERMFALDAISALKFDGALFRAATKNAMARSMVVHVVDECRKKNILTVAECIESAQDFELARSLGMDLMQGYYVDRIYQTADVAAVGARR